MFRIAPIPFSVVGIVLFNRVRTFLLVPAPEILWRNPGCTKDRIYDEVVSRMVRSDQMETHDLVELLRRVAEEAKVEREKGQGGRWYLKERPSIVAVQTSVYPRPQIIKATRWVAVSTLLHETFPELRPALALWNVG